MENQCGTEHGTAGCPCPCHDTGEGSCSGCAPMHGVTGADPVEMMAIMWRKAFFAAHMEFMKGKMKERIEATMGPMADKAADAVFEAMGKNWQAMMQQAGAETELREKLARIFCEGQK